MPYEENNSSELRSSISHCFLRCFRKFLFSFSIKAVLSFLQRGIKRISNISSLFFIPPPSAILSLQMWDIQDYWSFVAPGKIWEDKSKESLRHEHDKPEFPQSLRHLWLQWQTMTWGHWNEWDKSITKVAWFPTDVNNSCTIPEIKAKNMWISSFLLNGCILTRIGAGILSWSIPALRRMEKQQLSSTYLHWIQMLFHISSESSLNNMSFEHLLRCSEVPVQVPVHGSFQGYVTFWKACFSNMEGGIIKTFEFCICYSNLAPKALAAAHVNKKNSCAF